MNPRVPVFVSYAHEDESYLNQLLTVLKPLEMQDQVCAWSDLKIGVGKEWESAIEVSIGNAKAAVLLISQHFLASEFIRQSELPRLLDERCQGLPIFPLIVGPCLYDLAVFKYPDPEDGPEAFQLASIQTVNSPEKPLSKMAKSEREEVLVELARKLNDIWRGNS